MSSQKFHQWFNYIRKIQDFFLSQGFCPVETPILVPNASTEPYLEFFSTIRITQNKKQKLWLTASPEMHLKKLLCQGFSPIFEIHKSFRNNEEGPLHLNEFYMLEWYRTHTPWTKIMEDLEELLKFLQKILKFPLKLFKRYTVKELFQKHCDINLDPNSKKEDLIPRLNQFQIPYEKSFSFEDMFHLLFLNQIEKNLEKDIPTIIYNYPPSLRAYSQLNEEGWASRFEFYWKGLELANAFHEIQDAKEQLEIFQKDLENRKTDKDLSMDQELIEYMKKGMPPCVGIALGLERLFMAIYDYKDIHQVHPFF